MPTLKKSIEILNDLLGEGPQYPPDDRREAVKLGIEAMKEVRRSRNGNPAYAGELLPGEDEE